MTNQADKLNVAEAILCQAFSVQVPPHWDSSVKRRLFTIAARCNFDAVTDTVAGAMRDIGAIVPEKVGSNIDCFGQRWEPYNRICEICSRKSACEGHTKSLGLDKLKPSPKLLGSTSTRTPTISDTDVTDKVASIRVFPRSERDELLVEWLNEHLEPVFDGGSLYYRVTAAKNREGYAFCLGKPETLATIRFLHASHETKAKLEARSLSRNNGGAEEFYQYVLPDRLAYQESIDLFEKHAATLL